MKVDNSQPTPNDASVRRSRWPWILAAGCVLVLLLAVRQSLIKESQPARNVSKDTQQRELFGTFSASGPAHLPPRFSNSKPAQTAEEIVASKVVQFGKSRRKLVHALAKHFKVEVPDDVERFFDAVESGDWEKIDAAHEALLLSKDQLNQPRSAELHQIWRSIQETWGAAREAHNWPAQTLLDYGNAVLGSLKTGMIFAGGTDPGCFIPTMLNETSDGERHIVLTQNALADNTYLDYLNFLYGDRMATLTKDDSQQAFNNYIADAQKRLLHDQQFPNEPKQIRPGEDVRITDSNGIQVSGQVAVMAINEKLFQMLMDKNPDASFAMEQSFAFASMYPNSTPLGPVMELRVQDEQNALTAQRAAQSVDYWRTTAQQILSDADAANSPDVRMAYVKMASEQAALFSDRKFTAEAGQAYQIAIQLASSSPDVANYSKWLIPVVENGLKISPDNQQFRDFLNQLQQAKKD